MTKKERAYYREYYKKNAKKIQAQRKASFYAKFLRELDKMTIHK